jgi:hypothetical protein
VILTGDRAAARRNMRFRCRRFLSPFASRLELAQSRGGCGVRFGLDRAMLVDQSRSEWRILLSERAMNGTLGFTTFRTWRVAKVRWCGNAVATI